MMNSKHVSLYQVRPSMSSSNLSLVEFRESNLSQWAGMGDFLLVSPNCEHQIELIYEGEPPHGDSFHQVKIDARAFPGSAWGCMFAMSQCSRYLAMSWMRSRANWERLTAVVDMQDKRYFVLPYYLYQLQIAWPNIIGTEKTYTFDGSEEWRPF